MIQSKHKHSKNKTKNDATLCFHQVSLSSTTPSSSLPTPCLFSDLLVMLGHVTTLLTTFLFNIVHSFAILCGTVLILIPEPHFLPISPLSLRPTLLLVSSSPWYVMFNDTLLFLLLILILLAYLSTLSCFYPFVSIVILYYFGISPFSTPSPMCIGFTLPWYHSTYSSTFPHRTHINP